MPAWPGPVDRSAPCEPRWTPDLERFVQRALPDDAQLAEERIHLGVLAAPGPNQYHSTGPSLRKYFDAFALAARRP